MSLRHTTALLLVLAAAAPAAAADTPGDLNDMTEKAMKDAARKVAPSVVQILTQGGADQVVVGAKGLTFRKALGPTTGVIVGADGYVISSAFNFINNPTAILVLAGLPSCARRPLGGCRGKQDRIREPPRLAVTPCFRCGLRDRVPGLLLCVGRVLLDHRPDRGGDRPDVGGEPLR